MVCRRGISLLSEVPAFLLSGFRLERSLPRGSSTHNHTVASSDDLRHTKPYEQYMPNFGRFFTCMRTGFSKQYAGEFVWYFPRKSLLAFCGRDFPWEDPSLPGEAPRTTLPYSVASSDDFKAHEIHLSTKTLITFGRFFCQIPDVPRHIPPGASFKLSLTVVSSDELRHTEPYQPSHSKLSAFLF